MQRFVQRPREWGDDSGYMPLARPAFYRTSNNPNFAGLNPGLTSTPPTVPSGSNPRSTSQFPSPIAAPTKIARSVMVFNFSKPPLFRAAPAANTDYVGGVSLGQEPHFADIGKVTVGQKMKHQRGIRSLTRPLQPLTAAGRKSATTIPP